MKVLKIRKSNFYYEEIEDDLKSFQKEVDGYIEVVHLFGNFILICNEEGRIKNLEPTIQLINDFMFELICGNCFICKLSEDGENFEGISLQDYHELDDRITYNLHKNIFMMNIY